MQSWQWNIFLIGQEDTSEVKLDHSPNTENLQTVEMP